MSDLLTKRQGQSLRAIYRYLKDSGYPPTLADLREELEVSSNQSVIDLLKLLEQKGFIKKEEGTARGIRILQKGFDALSVRPIVPYVGITAAGPYTQAYEVVEWKSNGNGDAEISGMVVKVNGDSMVNAGIDDGDEVVVVPSKEFKNGDIVLARNHDETTIKRLVHENGRVYLKPENPTHKNIPIYPETRLVGKVVEVIGKSKKAWTRA